MKGTWQGGMDVRRGVIDDRFCNSSITMELRLNLERQIQKMQLPGLNFLTRCSSLSRKGSLSNITSVDP